MAVKHDRGWWSHFLFMQLFCDLAPNGLTVHIRATYRAVHHLCINVYLVSPLCQTCVILTRKIMEGRRHLTAFIRCLCDAIKGLGDCTEPVHLKLSAAFPLTFKSPSTCIDLLPTTVIRSIWCIKRTFAVGFYYVDLSKSGVGILLVCVCVRASVRACAAVSGQNQWSLRQVQLSK